MRERVHYKNPNNISPEDPLVGEWLKSTDGIVNLGVWENETMEHCMERHHKRNRRDRERDRERDRRDRERDRRDRERDRERSERLLREIKLKEELRIKTQKHMKMVMSVFNIFHY